LSNDRRWADHPKVRVKERVGKRTLEEAEVEDLIYSLVQVAGLEKKKRRRVVMPDRSSHMVQT